MAEGRDATVLDDLPESLIIEEILVRLPARDIFRCRVVHKSWRNGTSTNNFLLAHYRHQPSVPIISLFKGTNMGYDFIFSSLNDTGAATIARKFRYRNLLRWPRSRIGKDYPLVHAACDGLFIVSSCYNKGLFDVCNPTTRRHAPLPLLPKHTLPNRSIRIAAFYQNRLSGEYRVLYSIWTKNNGHVLTLNVDFYVLVVGSSDPRPIGQLSMPLELMDEVTCSCNAPVLYRGNLHWDLGRYFSDGDHNILVFDTTFETFRWMCHLTNVYIWMSFLEMNNVLSMCSSRDLFNIDIYVMEDYVAEVWTLICRLTISELEGRPPLEYTARGMLKIVMLNERELLIEQLGGPFLHYDIDGKFLRKIECDEIDDDCICVDITTHRFTENIVALPFFDTLNNMMLEDGGDAAMLYSIWP